MARTAEEQISVETTKGRVKLSVVQMDALAKSLAQRVETAGATVKVLRDQRVKRASQFSKSAASYLQARDAGSGAMTIRGAVELYKLRAMMPLEYQKIAYMPNTAWITAADQAVAGPEWVGVPDDNRDKAARAWEAYLNVVDPMSGLVMGSTDRMRRKYGNPPAFDSKTQAPLYAKWAKVREQEEIERDALARSEAALTQVGESWETFVARNPHLDTSKDETYAQFAQEQRLDRDLLPRVDAPYIRNLTAVAQNPDSEDAKGAFADIDALITQAQGEERAALDELKKLQSDPFGDMAGVEDDPSMRELLAGWLRQPEVQWWAEKNGFEVGKAEPVDPNSKLGQEIAAGRFPNKYIVNGMVYEVGPDDMRALRVATAQRNGDPDDNVLRALNLAHRTGPRKIVEFDEIVGYEQPPVLEKRGTLFDGDNVQGTVGLSSDGDYYWTTDGQAWTKVDAVAGQKMMEQAGDATDDTLVPLPGAKPKPITERRRGEFRQPAYGAPMGSLTYVPNDGKGQEVVVPADKLAGPETYPDGPPERAQSLASRLNAMSAARTSARAHRAAAETKKAEQAALVGEDQMGQEVPGVAPTKKQEAQRKAAARAVPAPVLDVVPEEGSPSAEGSVGPDEVPGIAAQRARLPRKLGEAPQITDRPRRLEDKQPPGPFQPGMLTGGLENQAPDYKRAFVQTPEKAQNFEATQHMPAEPATQSTTTSTMSAPLAGGAKAQWDEFQKRKKLTQAEAR